MADRRLTIVSGPIDSGKTSWCRELAANHPSYAGVLLLKVFLRSERIGYDALRLPLSCRVPFARLKGSEPSWWSDGQEVGPFSISPAGLQAANAWLAEAAARRQAVIIDEAGPLELEGGGLSPGLEAVLASPLRQKVYLVIRSGCVEAVCRRFGITGYSLVEPGAEPPDCLNPS